MSKTAMIVDFWPRTRVVVDVPEGVSTRDWLEKPENYDALIKKARKKMASDLPNYLCGDNMDWDFDFECPFGSLPSDKEDGAE